MIVIENTKANNKITVSEFKQVVNFLKYGEKGNMVWGDENNRCVKRISNEPNTLPVCELYENWNVTTEKGDFIGEALLYNAINFLYDKNYELIQ